MRIKLLTYSFRNAKQSFSEGATTQMRDNERAVLRYTFDGATLSCRPR